MSRLHRRERGSALILVIAALVLLSIIGTTFAALMRIESSATRNYNEDTLLRKLGQKAVAFILEHPNWDPPRDAVTTANNDVDNDNLGGVDSLFFTFPLADLTSDYHARFAVLKKAFQGRLNLNWNSFYVGATNDHHILNEGTSTGEISLVEPIARYLDYLGALPVLHSLYVPTGTPEENRLVAEEIARRLCNLRYGRPIRPLGIPSYLEGTDPDAKAYPGEDLADDDEFLDDTTLGVEPPKQDPPERDPDDVASWVPGNWRPQPAYDNVDNDGDGRFDELESVDEPDEFLQFFNGELADPVKYPDTRWFDNDDQPFTNLDMLSIITNSDSDLKREVNDVCNDWARTNVSIVYSDTDDYFARLRVLFTTFSRDYVGDMAPLNHLNLLPWNVTPAGDEEREAWREKVEEDRLRFVGHLTSALAAGGMGDSEAALLTAWQALVNLVDYLDDDVFRDAGTPYNYSVVTARDVAEEDATRTFFGTERFPHFNEFWIYNRGSDNFDQDAVPDGFIDAADYENLLPPPDPPAPWERDRNGYYIELTNLYATPIYLYNHLVPADPPGSDPTALPAAHPHYNWRIRITDTAGVVKREWDIKTDGQKWNPAAAGTDKWEPVDGAHEVYVPAGGQLVMVYHDYRIVTGEAMPPGDGLPDPADLDGKDLDGDGKPDIQMIRIKEDEDPEDPEDYTTPMFEAGDVVELVYWCDRGRVDEDGNKVSGDVEVVVDRQRIPADVLTRETIGHANPGTYHFAPSWERHDPRLARCVRVDPAALDVAEGDLLVPTWEYRDAEGIANTPGTGTGDGGEETFHTLGYVNDDGSDSTRDEVYDGNYDLGRDPTTRYDDLVDVPDSRSWKFGNVGALGKILCVGPLPPDPTTAGWSAPVLTTDPSFSAFASSPDYWLVRCSPYTAVPGDGAVEVYFSKDLPLDTKKIDFISNSVFGWDDVAHSISTIPPSFPPGRATGVFDNFTTLWPAGDGKDNDGNWRLNAVPSDDRDVTLKAPPPPPPESVFEDPWPTPGDAHVDETLGERYVYGRIDINEADEYVLSALPYVTYNDSTFYRPGAPSDLAGVFITSVGANGIYNIRYNDDNMRFDSRREFLTDVVHEWMYNVGAFAQDEEDNHIYEVDTNGNSSFEEVRTHATYEPCMWDTLRCSPRTTSSFPFPEQFKLPGQGSATVDFQNLWGNAYGDVAKGGDRLYDDKSELDYTVGALMNMIAINSEGPDQFAGGTKLGVYTYFITVQITDGHDVDGKGGNGPAYLPDGDPLKDDANEPDWKEGTVLGEKRLVLLLDTTRPVTDPRRVSQFTWSVLGRAPDR